LASVCAQSYSDWEAIIVDDHSRDGTIGQLHASFGREPRVRIVSRSGPRPGAQACRNEGLGLARGEFVIFLDSDDLLAPSSLARRIPAIETRPTTGFCVFLSEVFKEWPGDFCRLWNCFSDETDLYRFLSLDPPWCVSGPIWRKAVLLSLGGW